MRLEGEFPSVDTWRVAIMPLVRHQKPNGAEPVTCTLTVALPPGKTAWDAGSRVNIGGLGTGTVNRAAALVIALKRLVKV